MNRLRFSMNWRRFTMNRFAFTMKQFAFAAISAPFMENPVPFTANQGSARPGGGRSSLRRSLAAVVPAAPLSLSFSRQRLTYDSDAEYFSPAGKTERRFQRAQDIYMESAMGGEFSGEVL
jgi:hypothetical protein